MQFCPVFTDMQSRSHICSYFCSFCSRSIADSEFSKKPELIDTTKSVIPIPASIRAKVAALNAADLYPPSFSRTQICKSICQFAKFFIIMTFSNTDFSKFPNSVIFRFFLMFVLCSGVLKFVMKNFTFKYPFGLAFFLFST